MQTLNLALAASTLALTGIAPAMAADDTVRVRLVDRIRVRGIAIRDPDNGRLAGPPDRHPAVEPAVAPLFLP